jgi:IclR family pca regulon transcriptional regulator
MTPGPVDAWDEAAGEGAASEPLGTDDADEQERGRYYVRALERGMAVLGCFSDEHSHLTLTEVATRTGVSRAAARRFLLTFQDLGYVGQEDGRFFLTPKILELSMTYLSGLPIRDIAVPHMEQLTAGVGESSSLGVLDGVDAVHIARIATKRLMQSVIIVGSRLPAHASSLGKVMLAWLDEAALEEFFARSDLRPLTQHTVSDPDELRKQLRQIRSQGWALSDQELDLGLLSLGVPILDERGRAIAALNISTSLSRHPPEYLTVEVLPRLQATAAAISSAVILAGGGARVVVGL